MRLISRSVHEEDVLTALYPGCGGRRRLHAGPDGGFARLSVPGCHLPGRYFPPGHAATTSKTYHISTS